MSFSTTSCQSYVSVRQDSPGSPVIDVPLVYDVANESWVAFEPMSSFVFLVDGGAVSKEICITEDLSVPYLGSISFGIMALFFLACMYFVSSVHNRMIPKIPWSH